MKDYSYQDAGFDAFLSRSVDDLAQQNLDSRGPISTQVTFDRSQVSGPLGDTLQIGNITLNGSEGTIVLGDGENDRLIIGFQRDGF